MKIIMNVNYLLGLLSSLSLMQSCPFNEVGSTSTDVIEHSDPLEGHVYLNLDEKAMCNGTVYRWIYCFDPDRDRNNQLVLAVYRPQQNGTYQLVPGSYYELNLGRRNSFDCRDINLTPSKRFRVQQNDVVAFCEKIGTHRVEIFFPKPGGRVWHWDAGGCSEQGIRSTNVPSQSDGNVFLLKAFINCDVEIHNCHESATCSDVVGGFNCTCNTGFTGDGILCVNINECDEGIHNCHESADCSDVVGGFNCICNTGFTGDGTFCNDIDNVQHQSEFDIETTITISTVVVLIAVFCAVGVTVVVCIKRFQRNNENTVLHELTAQPNEAYDITDAYKLTAQPNEAYGITNKLTAEAYGITDAHEPTAQLNEAYGITDSHKITAQPNDIRDAHELTTQPNEVYGITDAREVTAQSNEAYGITDAREVTAQSNEAYGITDAREVTAQSNEAYGITDTCEVTAKPIDECGDTEYSYVQNN